MKPNPLPPPCYGGILICSWPVAIIISIMVQCFITAWRVDHRKRVYLRHHHQMARCGAGGLPTNRMSGRPRETREEASQRKYRYLYQVRTARGDIISQVRNKTPKLQLKATKRTLCRTLCQLCKSAYNWAAPKRPQNARLKRVRTNAIHFAAIAHTSLPYPIPKCATKSKLCVI